MVGFPVSRGSRIRLVGRSDDGKRFVLDVVLPSRPGRNPAYASYINIDQDAQVTHLLTCRIYQLTQLYHVNISSSIFDLT